VRNRTRYVIVIVLVLAGVIGTAYFASAWFAVRATAASIVSDEPPPGPGLADTSWYDRLGGPGPGELDIAAASPPGIVTPLELVFPLVLTNNANQKIAALSVRVAVRLTPRGWELVGSEAGR
jgi:hypothetical protein